MNIKQVKFSVHWSGEDGEWVATCDAFPLLSYLNEHADIAFANLYEIVEEVIEDINRHK